ncbi:MAG: hypothetical protein WCT32_04180 [Patescibacteria group bacterium]|jgi:DNA polymerase III delta prime subunit
MKAEEVLENDAKQNSWSHAYLFIGGKDQENEKLVGYFTESKGILSEDISVVAPSSDTGKSGEIKVEDVRRLIHEINLSPQGGGRLAVIHDCEKLNDSSANILLKTLEEPPRGATFILFSANSAVLPTIISRCRVSRIDSGADNESVESISIEWIKGGFALASKTIGDMTKDGKTKALLESIESYLRQQLLEKKEAKYAEAMILLHQCRRAIDGNANARLALEDLVLSLEKVW